MKTTEIQKWYLKGEYVPGLNSTAFAKFAAHGYALIASVNVTANTYSYIIDPTSPTAYFDRANHEIALPAWYFVEDGVSQYSKSLTKKFDALALINGSTVHETLHGNYTHYLMTDAIEMVKGLLGGKSNDKVVSLALNIVEDLFIESRPMSKKNHQWIDAKNDLLFNDDIVAKALEQLDADNPVTILAVLPAYKRPACREKLAEVLSDEVVRNLKHACLPVDYNEHDRMKIAYELIKALHLEDVDATPTMGDGSSDVSDGEKTDGTESLPEPGKGIDGGYGEEGEEIRKAIENNSKSIMKMKKAFEKEARREIEKATIAKDVDESGKVLDNLAKSLRTVEVEQICYDATRTLPEIALSNRFATMLKRMRTVLPQRGRGKESGARIDPLRLHQIAIDNKVFSTRTIDRSANNDKVEIIILVDASGSMGSPAIGVDGYTGSLFRKSIGVTHKIFKALLNTGVSTKVFAHTSYGEYDFPELIKIVDGSTKLFDKKFRLSLTINKRENLDGIIINEIVKNYFSDDSRVRKVLLVLSDGAPQSPNYSGFTGKAHTITAIENARKNNVSVYALSLISRVVDGNNEIYGKNYNVDASGDLDKAMTELVTRLVVRK